MDRLDIDDPLVSRPEVPAIAGLRLAKPAPRPRIGGYRLGMIGGILRLQVDSGFCANAQAEARTATDIAAFVRAFDPICDLLVGAFVDDELIGTIAVDGRLQGSGIAAIRWFSVERSQPRRTAEDARGSLRKDYCVTITKVTACEKLAAALVRSR